MCFCPGGSKTTASRRSRPTTKSTCPETAAFAHEFKTRAREHNKHERKSETNETGCDAGVRSMNPLAGALALYARCSESYLRRKSAQPKIVRSSVSVQTSVRASGCVCVVCFYESVCLSATRGSRSPSDSDMVLCRIEKRHLFFLPNFSALIDLSNSGKN